jgi:predicted dehydrogenase
MPPSFAEHGCSRRAILAAGGAATIGGLWPARVPARPIGANDRIRVGVIGVGGRGTLLVDQLPEGGEIVALADCNLPRAEACRAERKASWDVVADYRRLLDRPDIDAVIVATGDFQRVLPCIHACQAGKDIYAEKPLSLSIGEGRALVDAVRRHERVLQVGTQQRSMAINRAACGLIRTGGLGRVLEVRAINYTGPREAPPEGFPAEPVPAGLDWDAWLAQATDRPFHRQWLGWMQWRDFSGGQMTNWGAHGVDQIQWALGADGTGPVAVEPLGEGANAPVRMRYADGTVVNFVLEQGKGPMGGAVFVCERGKLEINRNKVVSNPPEIARELLAALDAVEEERRWSDSTALWQARWHMEDWLDAMRTRRRPVADVEIGHRSISVCHLANIARRVGRPLAWDPAAERFAGESLDALLDPPRRTGHELPA